MSAIRRRYRRRRHRRRYHLQRIRHQTQTLDHQHHPRRRLFDFIGALRILLFWVLLFLRLAVVIAAPENHWVTNIAKRCTGFA